MRDFHLPGRSPVRVGEAAAATSHPLATLAAIDVLRAGGNAVDAAVAAAAVLCVVEPQSTGIGGDGFMLYCPGGSDTVIAYNGSGRSPAAATVEWYREHGFSEIPTAGPHAVTVPGVVDAWTRILADHGRTELASLLGPAIRYAEEGYVVQDRVARDWGLRRELLAADPAAARILLPGGRTPRAGERHRQPELARTLRCIARHGRDGFYAGEVAEDLVDRLRALGGLHTLDDFQATRGEYVEPVRTVYRGIEICQMPPNNQGLTALIMLNILSGYALADLDPLGADRLHLEIEAGRLAYRDRDALIGDPAQSCIPVHRILSADHAAALRRLIDPARTNPLLPPPLMDRSDTVYLAVVDRDRNAVSFINSLYHSFGSGVVGPRSGVVLQNRGASFRLDPRHPNCIGPSKRPMHTIMPGMAVAGGRAMMPFGVMGADYQPFGHVHYLTNLIDYAMDPQSALDFPRVFHDNGVVEAERGVPAATVAGLVAKGHRVVVPDAPLGGGQAVLIDWREGTLTAASDPRKDGCALGY
jgi:gamma-glutamyltranspeptidase / glutathione hydrolase